MPAGYAFVMRDTRYSCPMQWVSLTGLLLGFLKCLLYFCGEGGVIRYLISQHPLHLAEERGGAGPVTVRS